MGENRCSCLDSLQATYIRRAISYALQQSLKIPPSRVPQSLVYDHPTITLLVLFVRQLLLPSETGDSRTETSAPMLAMLAKYSAGFPSHPSLEQPPVHTVAKTVIVTGTTGRLGCHVLAQLLRTPSVDKVYALNRGSQGDMDDRQRVAFEACGLDLALLQSQKVSLLSANLAEDNLGLSETLYQEVSVHSHSAN